MNVIRTIPAPERRSLKRLSTQAATPTVRAQVLAVTDEEVPEDTYDPVNWQPGDLITAKRLNQTDEGVDKTQRRSRRSNLTSPIRSKPVLSTIFFNVQGLIKPWLISFLTLPVFPTTTPS